MSHSEDEKDQPHEDLAGTAVTNWQQDGNHQEESEEPRDSGRGQVETAQLSLEPSTTERQEGKAGSDLSWSPRITSHRKRKQEQGSSFDTDEEEEEFETPKRILLDTDVTLPDIPLPPIQASWDPLPAPESQTSYENIRRAQANHTLPLESPPRAPQEEDWTQENWGTGGALLPDNTNINPVPYLYWYPPAFPVPAPVVQYILRPRYRSLIKPIRAKFPCYPILRKPTVKSFYRRTIRKRI
ncbi:PREDICTED: uncharacterized protein LOC106893676 [Calidris pugnax]|uniref:uncharacterized protein LOC106893676 n=1 Tax=Calidris pugnax TaxID=198806 RepID=UPI00071D90D4|nr:PREDICTED: uncharacterized protein LOC106893676 [Calidris pugnax]